MKRIVTARKRFGWCASKLKAYLQSRWPHESWPAASTIGDILGREGLIKPRPKRRLKAMPSPLPLIEPQAPNELWTIDFKGQFRLGNRRWCFPLTLVDDYSRYVLCCDGVSKVSREQILPSLTKAFRRYGLPKTIRSDNGPPFATNGVVGLSKLGVWWTKLGIRQERIHPGKPQQNGRHERMHRTLKQEALAVIQTDMPQQQRALNRWRKTFNEIRPHEALDNRQPTQLYQPSAWAYREPRAEISYPSDHEVRRVRNQGSFKWRSNLLFISEALIGEPLGLKQIDEHRWHIYFIDLKIAMMDTELMKVLPM